MSESAHEWQPGWLPLINAVFGSSHTLFIKRATALYAAGYVEVREIIKDRFEYRLAPGLSPDDARTLAALLCPDTA